MAASQLFDDWMEERSCLKIKLDIVLELMIENGYSGTITNKIVAFEYNRLFNTNLKPDDLFSIWAYIENKLFELFRKRDPSIIKPVVQ